ncbi:MAG: acyl carrier protein [Lachnospiraceae bacterium]|nr:acyl carrier protein [Lachnospiraceae bacterium]
MYEKLVNLICNYVEVKPENITPDSRFMEDLGFTSFDFMSMLGELEDEFDIEVDEQKAADIRTIQEAVTYLEGLVGQE